METINKFLDGNGKIKTIPRKQKNRVIIFEYVTDFISQKGTHFTEQELNNIIKEIYTDFATMRRYLIDYQYMERDPYGKDYRVIGCKNNEK